MKRVCLTSLTATVFFIASAGYGWNLSMQGISSELEDAFLDKPKAIKNEENETRRIPDGTISGVTVEKRVLFTEGEKWRSRLEAILDIPRVPIPEGVMLEALNVPGSKFVVAVYNAGEEGVVRNTRRIAWTRVKVLFTRDSLPLIHVMPVSGGTFSAGRASYAIINELGGFNVIYTPRGMARKVSLTFSGNEGTLLTPEGFVCRIIRHIPDGGGEK